MDQEDFLFILINTRKITSSSGFPSESVSQRLVQLQPWSHSLRMSSKGSLRKMCLSVVRWFPELKRGEKPRKQKCLSSLLVFIFLWKAFYLWINWESIPFRFFLYEEHPLEAQTQFEHDLEILVESFNSDNNSIKYLIFICLPSLGF